MIMWVYAIIFVGSFIFDVIPFAGPPAWTIMLFFYSNYGLNPWTVLGFGVTGSVLGRYTMSQYFGEFAHRFITEQKNIDLNFLGNKLNHNRGRAWGLVFLYTLLPIPTTPLFNLAGIAKVHPLAILPPFFVGKFISDGYMLLAGHIIVTDIPAMLAGVISIKSLLIMLFTIFSMVALLFIDWISLLNYKKFKLKFNIFK